LWDSSLEAEWTVDLQGRPPDSHFYVDENVDVEIAGELPCSYMDLNENEEWDAEDQIGFGACIGENVVLLAYLDEPEVLQTALAFQLSGQRPGWSIVKFGVEDGESPFVEYADYAKFWIGPTCHWEAPEPE
jgi:hypothetical protein